MGEKWKHFRYLVMHMNLIVVITVHNNERIICTMDHLQYDSVRIQFVLKVATVHVMYVYSQRHLYCPCSHGQRCSGRNDKSLSQVVDVEIPAVQQRRC